MPLAPGAKLGPYEVLALIGSGGMGEVWKARDTRLDRLVALKVLSGDTTNDPERKRRFTQEAKAASALNHPNIVTIYDIGTDNGVEYIAMELVPGKPLDQLIPRGGLGVPEILRYSAQLADALGKAHAAGIVHRDLKPANVMVTPDGLLKVLDFGLAKLTQPVEGNSEETQTIAAHTVEGTVMGTTAYMSPEQVEAKPLDGRSDIFSFGLVLYEMSTGQRAFQGTSRMSILSAILRDEPPAAMELRADLPVQLGRVIARCLRKDPARRYQHAADLKVELEEIKDELKDDADSGKLSAPLPSRDPLPTSRRALIVTAIAAALVVIAVGGYFLRPAPPPVETVFKPVPLTSYPGRQTDPSFSPDGNQVAFTWNGEKRDNFDIYVKLVGPGAPLRLTTDPARDYGPEWSPDGRSIAFVREISTNNLVILIMPALGGTERKVAQIYTDTLSYIAIDPNPLSWTPDSKFLVVAGGPTPENADRLHLIAAETGEIRTLTNPPAQSSDIMPAISPDGRMLAYIHSTGMNLNSLNVLQLSENFLPQGEPRNIPTGGESVYDPAWAPDGGEIIVGAGASTALQFIRVSSSGSGQPTRLVWAGNSAVAPATSPRSHRMVYARMFQDTNIWRVDLSGTNGMPGKNAAPSTLLASSFREVFPQYSPDGRRLVFHSDRSGSPQIWASAADGSQAVELTQMEATSTGTARWSPDGQQISFDSNAGGTWQVYVIGADGGKPRALTNHRSTNVIASWSRDGRWVYFGSNRTGEFQIWKVPAQGGAEVQVTHMGGTASVESPDGKWVYFSKDDGNAGIWKIPVEGGAETQVLKAGVFRYNFVVTDAGIYYTPLREKDGSSSVQFFKFAGGTTTEIAKIPNTVDLGLALSPDGKQLLFAQIDYRGSNLMLVENFR